MVINTLTWALAKQWLKDVAAFVKKYWQFFLGLSVGIVFLFLKGDRSQMRKTLQKFKETSEKMRDESIRISEDESSKSLEVVEEFKEEIGEASEKLIQRQAEIEEKKDKIKRELLEKEKKDPGSIAKELQEEIDNI